MKASPKKLLALTLFAIAVTSLVCVRPAQAYTVTLRQVGSNVVATGSGEIDLLGLTLIQPNSSNFARIFPAPGLILTGPTFQSIDVYGNVTGPSSFGSGGDTEASSGTGDMVGIGGGSRELGVPQGYTSFSPLSSTSTWNNATFSSLGVTPGTYTWSWGTGLPNQNFTLIIGGAGVPDGGSTVLLLGLTLVGLLAVRRKLNC